jgi:hypothetical protein
MPWPKEFGELVHISFEYREKQKKYYFGSQSDDLGLLLQTPLLQSGTGLDSKMHYNGNGEGP